jgi:diguanylate cyclase (GGDEF)-like protein
VSAGPASPLDARDVDVIVDVTEDLLSEITARIVEELDVAECDLYEYLPETDELLAVAVSGRDPADEHLEWVGARLSLSQRPTYLAVVRDRRVRETCCDDPELGAAGRDLLASWGEKAALHMPLLWRDEVVGVLTLIERREPRHFTDADKRLLALLAVPAAVAMRTAADWREQAERNRATASLLESIRAMTSSASVSDVLDVVARKSAEALGVTSAAIYEYEPEHDCIVLRAQYDALPLADEIMKIGNAYSLVDYPDDKEIMVRGEVREQQLSDPLLAERTRQTMERFGEQSCLSVPLTFQGELVGLLEIVEGRHERHFRAHERELARGLGEQAGAAIHNARMFRELEEQNRRLECLLNDLKRATDQLGNELQILHSLLELSEDLLSLRDEAAVFEKIAGALRHLVSYETMEISLVDEEAQEIVEVFLGEGSVNQTLGFRMPLGKGVTGSVLESGHAEMVNDMLHDPRGVLVPGTDREEQASILAPLQVGGKVIGVLTMSRYEGRRFTEREFEMVKLITNLTAIAIWNSRLFGDMADKAIHDGLTGLYNHRHFWERLGQEVARAQRYGSSLSLLMIDLDDFKLYNDTLGHLLGDTVLREIARILQDQVRKDVDIVARYGGEEFAVLLPNTRCDPQASAAGGVAEEALAVVEAAVGVEEEPQIVQNPRTGGARRAEPRPPEGLDCGARVVGERIREQVEKRAFAQGGRPLTVSIGVAVLPDSAYDGYHLVQNADKALYLAKRLGKNRVEVYRR